LARMLP